MLCHHCCLPALFPQFHFTSAGRKFYGKTVFLRTTILSPASFSAALTFYDSLKKVMTTDLQTLLLFCLSRCSIDKWKCYLIFLQEWVEVKTLKVDEGGRSLITSQQLDVKLDFARYKIKVMSKLRKT